MRIALLLCAASVLGFTVLFMVTESKRSALGLTAACLLTFWVQVASWIS